MEYAFACHVNGRPRVKSRHGSVTISRWMAEGSSLGADGPRQLSVIGLDLDFWDHDSNSA